MEGDVIAAGIGVATAVGGTIVAAAKWFGSYLSALQQRNETALGKIVDSQAAQIDRIHKDCKDERAQDRVEFLAALARRDDEFTKALANLEAEFSQHRDDDREQRNLDREQRDRDRNAILKLGSGVDSGVFRPDSPASKALKANTPKPRERGSSDERRRDIPDAG